MIIKISSSASILTIRDHPVHVVHVVRSYDHPVHVVHVVHVVSSSKLFRKTSKPYSLAYVCVNIVK